MNNKLSPVVFLFTLAAVVLGGIAGYFMPEFMLSISFIGKLFLNSLKIIAIPFVITMIIAGTASMGSKDKVKRSLGKTALYFTATSLTASFVGVLLSLIIQPGVGASKTGAYIPKEIVPHLSSFSFNNLFSSFIPDNFLSASVEIQLFAVILFAFLLGAVLTTVDRKNRIVLDFFLSLKEMLSQLMKFIFYIAPIGLFSLAGTLFAENSQYSEMLYSSLALFTVTILFGLSFFALVILPIIAKMFSNVSPYHYFTSMIPALSTAFATNSAVATLPITEKCIQTTSIDQRASAFVLPLGALFNASGTALFLSASAIFIAQLYGLTISIGQILAIIGGAFFIASITAFIPYASLFMLALVLHIAKFPIAGIGLLVLVDFLFGRIRSVVDVWSDTVGVAVLGNTFDFKTARSAKAAIPARRTYNRTKPKTSRDKHKTKSDYPKTKRENKLKSQSKPNNGRKKTKETAKKEVVSKETNSPFQISPDTDYFAEIKKNSDNVTPVKPEQKKQKSPIVKHELKTAKLSKEPAKKDSQKPAQTTKKEQKKPEKSKPIIHKIEVPPLPIIPAAKTTQTAPIKKETEEPAKPLIKEKQTDEDSVITKASAILSQDTIERERAKIAAQLNLMRERESLQDTPHIEKQPEVIDTADKIPEKFQEDQFTKIDFYSDVEPIAQTEPVVQDEPVLQNKPIELSKNSDSASSTELSVSTVQEQPILDTKEPNEESDMTAVPEEKSAIVYGRKPSKRSVAKKSEETASTPESDSQKTSVEKNEFAVENMSFGRSKRKK